MKGLFKTTNFYRKYWQKRKIDWVQAYMTPEHSHRALIIQHLRDFKFKSVLEVGCGAGANLLRIKTVFPWVDVGGIDWNVEAIETAKKYLPKSSILQVGEANDIYLSWKGADILLSDMCLIYMDKKNFRKVIQEAKRIARVGVVFCEFHHSNWLMRKALKFGTGYNAYDYKKELEKEGFYDIKMTKITEKDWPGGEPQKSFGWIISARPV